MIVSRSIASSLRTNPDFEERTGTTERLLITAWEAGRTMAARNPDLANLAKAGELVVLPYKGGVERAIKGRKTGTLFYLAMWQGLRGDDLTIDTASNPVMVCTRTGVEIRYTAEYSEYANA